MFLFICNSCIRNIYPAIILFKMMFNNSFSLTKVERLLDYPFIELEQNKWNAGLRELLKECSGTDAKKTCVLINKVRSLVKFEKQLLKMLKVQNQKDIIAQVSKKMRALTHVQGFIASLLEMKTHQTKPTTKECLSHALDKNLNELQAIFKKITDQFNVLQIKKEQQKPRFRENLQSHLIAHINALKEKCTELGRRMGKIVDIIEQMVKNPQGIASNQQELEKEVGHYLLSKNLEKIIQRLNGSGQENSKQAEQYEMFLQDYILQVFRITFPGKYNLDISARQDISSFLEAEKSNLLKELRSLKFIEIIYQKMKTQEPASKISGNIFKMQDQMTILMAKLKDKEAQAGNLTKQNAKMKQTIQQLMKEREEQCKKIEKLQISNKLNKTSIQISESAAQLYQAAQKTITQLQQKNAAIRKSLEKICKSQPNNCSDEMAMISHIQRLISTYEKDNQSCKQAISIFQAEIERLKIDCLNKNTLLEQFKNESANDQKEWLNNKQELQEQVELCKRMLQKERQANEASKCVMQEQLSKSLQDIEQLKAQYQQQCNNQQDNSLQENIILQGEIKKLQDKLVEANQNSSHNEKISQLQQKCNQIDSQNKLCRQQFNRLEADFKLLQQKKSGFEQALSKVKQLNEQLQNQIEEKSRLLSLQQTQARHLSQQNGNLSSELNTHQSSLNKKDNQIEQFIAKIQEAGTKNEELSEKIKAFASNQEILEELRQANSKLLSTITLLNERQSRSNQTISQLRAQVSTANKKARNLQAEYDMLQDNFSVKSTQIDVLGYNMEQVQQELKDSYQARIRELEQILKYQRQESKKHQIEAADNADSIIGKGRGIQQLRKQLAQKDQYIRKIKEETSSLRKISDVSKVPLQMKQQVRKKIEEQFQDQILQLRQRYTTLYQQKYSKFSNKSLQELDSIALMYIEQLFSHQLLQSRIELKFRILSHLFAFNNRTVTRTRLVFKFDPQNPTNFHKYIDGKANLICIVKTTLGAYLAAYYSGVYEQSIMTEPGLLISITNNDSYELHPSENRANSRTMVYDPYFLIFGNAEFRIRSGERNIFCNFGIMNSYFNHRNKKVQNFLCAGSERETEMESYEIYEIEYQQEGERSREMVDRQ